MSETPSLPPGTDVDQEVIQHWGCQFCRQDGTVYITRWNPGHGSGENIPYTENEAKADVAITVEGFRKVLVTRKQATTIITTPWEEVQ